MKKVIIFTSDLYQGGVAESTRKIVKLINNDFEVTLCSYDSLPINKTLPQHVNVEVLNCPLSVGFRSSRVGRVIAKIFRYLFFPIAFIKFFLLVFRTKPDCVYSMTYIPNIINILVSFFLKYKSVISERQDPREDLGEVGVMPRILKNLYPKSNLIHANSLEMIAAIEEYYNIPREKIIHFDNFFFLDELVKLGSEPVSDMIFSSKYTLVTSGRLSKQKGQWHLIQIIKRIRDKGIDVSLVILGDGELKHELSRTVSHLCLTEHVFFVGNVKNPHKYVSKSHLFIFSSIWESFGNTLVEAMALGIPIASTVCRSGPKQIINDGEFGLNMGIFPPYGKDLDQKSLDSISDDIIDVLENKYDYYSMMSRKGFSRFDESTAYNRIKEMINV